MFFLLNTLTKCFCCHFRDILTTDRLLCSISSKSNKKCLISWYDVAGSFARYKELFDIVYKFPKMVTPRTKMDHLHICSLVFYNRKYKNIFDNDIRYYIYLLFPVFLLLLQILLNLARSFP